MRWSICVHFDKFSLHRKPGLVNSIGITPDNGPEIRIMCQVVHRQIILDVVKSQHNINEIAEPVRQNDRLDQSAIIAQAYLHTLIVFKSNAVDTFV